MRISQQTHEFACEALEDEVQGFYDDPIGMTYDPEAFHQFKRSVVVESCINRLKAIATDLGLNWKELVANNSHEHERERIKALLNE